MKILFDQGTPAPLRSVLQPCSKAVLTSCPVRCWRNGELLKQAEAAGFALFITTDQKLKYQQNLGGRRIAILVLPTTSWPRIALKLSLVSDAVDRAESGGYLEVEF